jgi:hypothetical protein
MCSVDVQRHRQRPRSASTRATDTPPPMAGARGTARRTRSPRQPGAQRGSHMRWRAERVVHTQSPQTHCGSATIAQALLIALNGAQSLQQRPGAHPGLSLPGAAPDTEQHTQHLGGDTTAIRVMGAPSAQRLADAGRSRCETWPTHRWANRWAKRAGQRCLQTTPRPGARPSGANKHGAYGPWRGGECAFHTREVAGSKPAAPMTRSPAPVWFSSAPSTSSSSIPPNALRDLHTVGNERTPMARDEVAELERVQWAHDPEVDGPGADYCRSRWPDRSQLRAAEIDTRPSDSAGRFTATRGCLTVSATQTIPSPPCD